MIDEKQLRRMRAVRGRIALAFDELRRRGYFAEAKWQCCMGCGVAAMPAGTKQWVFYHRQDAEAFNPRRERFGNPVYLCWAGDAKQIRESLEACGLAVEHDGDRSTRIKVVGPARRTPSPAGNGVSR